MGRSELIEAMRLRFPASRIWRCAASGSNVNGAERSDSRRRRPARGLKQGDVLVVAGETSPELTVRVGARELIVIVISSVLP